MRYASCTAQLRRADGAAAAQSAWAAQRGQALAECCVLLLVLAPIFLLLPLLGRYIDLVQTTEVASRYVAFEAIAHDPLNGQLHDDEMGRQVARRFFSRSDVPIKTLEQPSNDVAERNPLWVDLKGAPLVADLTKDVTAVTRVLSRDAFPLAKLWSNALELRSRNLVDASISVQIASKGPLISRKTALLVDDWSALGPADVQSRIEHGGLSIYPTDYIGPLVTLAGVLPLLLTDERLKPGLPDWDIIPCDRLQGGC